MFTQQVKKVNEWANKRQLLFNMACLNAKTFSIVSVFWNDFRIGFLFVKSKKSLALIEIKVFSHSRFPLLSCRVVCFYFGTISKQQRQKQKLETCLSVLKIWLNKGAYRLLVLGVLLVVVLFPPLPTFFDTRFWRRKQRGKERMATLKAKMFTSLSSLLRSVVTGRLIGFAQSADFFIFIITLNKREKVPKRIVKLHSFCLQLSTFSHF